MARREKEDQNGPSAWKQRMDKLRDANASLGWLTPDELRAHEQTKINETAELFGPAHRRAERQVIRETRKGYAQDDVQRGRAARSAHDAALDARYKDR